jgi:Flp pilus assembly protein TadD
LGFAYGMVGRVPQEINEYHEAVRLGLDMWDLFLNLGLAHLDQHELTSASAALEKAVLLGPEHAETHFNLAIVYETENRLSEALREIAAARHLAPADPDAANTHAIICAEMGNLACSRDVWAQMVQSAPDQANLAILNRYSTGAGQFERRPEILRYSSGSYH